MKTKLSEVRYSPDGKGGAYLSMDGTTIGFIGAEKDACQLVRRIGAYHEAAVTTMDYWQACADSARKTGKEQRHPASHCAADNQQLSAMSVAAFLSLAKAINLDPLDFDWKVTGFGVVVSHSVELTAAVMLFAEALDSYATKHWSGGIPEELSLPLNVLLGVLDAIEKDMPEPEGSEEDPQ